MVKIIHLNSGFMIFLMLPVTVLIVTNVTSVTMASITNVIVIVMISKR